MDSKTNREKMDQSQQSPSSWIKQQIRRFGNTFDEFRTNANFQVMKTVKKPRQQKEVENSRANHVPCKDIPYIIDVQSKVLNDIDRQLDSIQHLSTMVSSQHDLLINLYKITAEQQNMIKHQQIQIMEMQKHLLSTSTSFEPDFSSFIPNSASLNSTQNVTKATSGHSGLSPSETTFHQEAEANAMTGSIRPTGSDSSKQSNHFELLMKPSCQASLVNQNHQLGSAQATENKIILPAMHCSYRPDVNFQKESHEIINRGTVSLPEETENEMRLRHTASPQPTTPGQC